MMTHIIAILIPAVAYGALWHNQPARRRNHQGADGLFPVGGWFQRALEWLLLIPHLPNPAEQEEPIPISGKSAAPARLTKFFRPVLQAVRGWNPWTGLFKSKLETNELAAERITRPV